MQELRVDYAAKLGAAEEKYQAAKSSVNRAVHKWVLGDVSGLQKAVFVDWHRWHRLERAAEKAEAEQRRIADFLGGELSEQRVQHALELTKTEQKHQAAKTSVKSAVARWVLGDVKGLMKTLVTDWHQY